MIESAANAKFKRIQKLMKQVRQEEISLRKTELKALQAQINPHFLYKGNKVSNCCTNAR